MPCQQGHHRCNCKKTTESGCSRHGGNTPPECVVSLCERHLGASGFPGNLRSTRSQWACPTWFLFLFSIIPFQYIYIYIGIYSGNSTQYGGRGPVGGLGGGGGPGGRGGHSHGCSSSQDYFDGREWSQALGKVRGNRTASREKGFLWLHILGNHGSNASTSI